MQLAPGHVNLVRGVRFDTPVINESKSQRSAGHNFCQDNAELSFGNNEIAHSTGIILRLRGINP